MATLITIVDTIKAGFITVKTNDFYNSGAVELKEMNITKASINAVNIIKDTDGQTYVKIHRSDTGKSFDVSSNLTQSKFYPIQSVNGVAPADSDNLKDLILALIP